MGNLVTGFKRRHVAIFRKQRLEHVIAWMWMTLFPRSSITKIATALITAGATFELLPMRRIALIDP